MAVLAGKTEVPAAGTDPAREFLKLDEEFQAFAGRSSGAVEGEVIVRFRPQSPHAARQAALDAVAAETKFFGHGGATARLQAVAGNAPARESVFGQLARVKLREGVNLSRALAHLRGRKEVVYAEPNYRVHVASPAGITPNDFDFDTLWNLQTAGAEEGKGSGGIAVAEAWLSGTGSRRVKVAVIDTGIDFFHPDLSANIHASGDLPGNGLDDDGNGYVDDVHGYDFVDHDGDPLDDNGHGTHVAGIIGAVGNNKIGISGVCWQVSLMALKAFDEQGDASMSDIVEAIQYAIDNKADILNASWGQTTRSLALADAVAEAVTAGILVVAAAGNDNSDAPFFPAWLPEVISVAATDEAGARARFSNYGPRVDVAAPGVWIYSTLPDSRYDSFSGTSMSVPHVCGLAALILSNHPEFSSRDLANILRNAVDPTASVDKPIGTGRINASKAAVIDTPLPSGKLDLPGVIRGEMAIRGTASGTNFFRYRLEHGTGASPVTWTEFHSSEKPVENGVLLGAFSTTKLPEGIHSFRLRVENAGGHAASDRAVVSVRNVDVAFPLDNDILRAGDKIVIRGTVFGEGRTYRIEHGAGASPEIWSSAGITPSDGGTRTVLEGTLAEWDTSGLAADTFYSLRLVATAADGAVNEKIVRNVYLDSRLKPGWPQYIPISGSFNTNDWRNITVADLAGDGLKELITVDPGSDDGAAARLLVYKFDGTLLWARDLAGGEPRSDVPVAGDIDGDGRQEIFVDAGEGRQIFAFRHDGTPLGGNWPVTMEAGNLGKVLADLDGDGRKELIVYSLDTVERFGTDMRLLAVLDAEGKILRKWYLGNCDSEVDAGKIFPAIGNLDDEPDLEIAVPSGCQMLSVFKWNKQDGPLWSAGVEGQLVSSPVIGDIDGDGKNEIVIGSYDDSKLARGGLFAFDHAGKRYSGWPVLQGDSFASAPALADLDGDGALEICALGLSSELLHVVHHYGFEMNGWPAGPIRDSTVRTSPSVGDIDGDGRPDLVIASPGYLYLAFTGGDLSYLGGVRAWSADGLPIVLSRSHGTLPMEGSGGAWHKSAPVTLADIDNDGKLDLIAASIQDRTYGLAGERGGRKNRSSIYVWGTNTRFDAGNMPWPMLQGDAQHTGFFPRPRHINQPPVALKIPDQIIPPGGAFVPIDLSGYVEDPDNSPREMRWSVSGSSALQAVISPAGVLTVTAPDANWTGPETLRFVAADPAGLQSETSAVYSARAGYVPPVAVEDEVFTLEDEPVEFDPLRNDLNPNAGSLDVLGFNRPRLGKVKRAPGGRLVYTPNPYSHGKDEFTYTLGDGKGGLAIGTVKITVMHVNHPPEPAADYVILDEDTDVVIDILANDKDPDGDALSRISFSQPVHGVVTSLPDGKLRYTPAKKFFGSDSFSYKAADSFGVEERGVVNILVKHVNHPPDGPDLAFTLNRNNSLDIFLAAEDPDEDELSFQVVRSPEHGEILAYPTIAGYTPVKGFSGSDSFTYTANDGQADSREITVTLTVTGENNPPKLDDLSLITRLDRERAVQLSAVDADGDEPMFRIVEPPMHGTLTGSGADYVYRPERGFLGEDGFTWEASDNAGGVGKGHVRIKVTTENTAPAGEDRDVKVRSNTPLEILLKAVDPEGDPLTFTLLTEPVNGILSGTAPKLTYTPAASFVGPDRFTFKASDGELESKEAIITLGIEPLNHPAAVTNQIVHVQKNGRASFALDVTDEEGDRLAAPILKGPRHGRLFGVSTNFTYIPAPDYAGEDEFTYKVWDGLVYSKSAKVSIQVAPDPPEVKPAFQTVRRDEEGRVHLTLRSQAGKQYEISVSRDLIEWRPLLSAQAEGGTLSITDPEREDSGARFYRAIRK